MTFEKKLKDPDSVLDYGMDWAAWLDTDEISDSDWEIADAQPEEPGSAIDSLSITSESFTTTATTVWLSAGVLGTVYVVTNRITTKAGRVDDRSMRIQIKEQ